ncbi:hypothetical protein FB446DRAFT_848776 [Lentinula raphanica]|nr:hypothetical protein FB446DRAFT_848776 [Lentinula raphanica]
MNIVYLVTLALISVTCAVPVTNNKPQLELLPSDVTIESRGNAVSAVATDILMRFPFTPEYYIVALNPRLGVTAAERLETCIDAIETYWRRKPAGPPTQMRPEAHCRFLDNVKMLEQGSPTKASAAGSLRVDHTFRYSFFLGKHQEETQNPNDNERARKAIDAVFWRFRELFGLEHEQLGGKLSATDNFKIFGAHINTEFSLELNPEGRTESEKKVVKGPCNLWLSFRGNNELWVTWAGRLDSTDDFYVMEIISLQS